MHQMRAQAAGTQLVQPLRLSHELEMVGTVNSCTSSAVEAVNPRAWTLLVPLPVWTVNQSRNHHHHREAALVKEYRSTTRMLARAARIPHLDRIAVEFTPHGPAIRQDTAACAPAAKACLDGLVDAGVLDDDRPEFVPTVNFHAPRRGPHGLFVLIVDLADVMPAWGTWEARLALDA